MSRDVRICLWARATYPWLAMRDYDTRSQRGQPFFEENGIPDWYQNTILFVWLLIATSISLFNLDYMKMKVDMNIWKNVKICSTILFLNNTNLRLCLITN